MIWKNKFLDTYADFLQAVVDVKSPEEAKDFLENCKLENPNVDEMVGWMIGDVDKEVGQRIIDWFDVGHPVFGKKYPTPEEAYTAGRNYSFIKNLE